MTAFLIFVALPAGLIVLSFFIRPQERDARHGDRASDGGGGQVEKPVGYVHGSPSVGMVRSEWFGRSGSVGLEA